MVAPAGRIASNQTAVSGGNAIVGRIRSEYRRRGLWKTICFLAGRILRRWDSVVYDARPSTTPASESWQENERLEVIGPDNVDQSLTPELKSFLGGDGAAENIESVRRGDRLFVVSNGGEHLHCGYIMFGSRQSRIIGEDGAPPLIGCCRTVPAAQGRGLYRKALRAEVQYLAGLGYERVVVETAPDNVPSRRGIETAGFALCREATSWVFCNKVVVQRTVERGVVRWRAFTV